MKVRPMGMSVDQAMNAMTLDRIQDGFRVGIHDFERFTPFVPAAFKAVPAGIKTTNPKRFAKGIVTPFGCSDALSGCLIADIIRAKQIPMGQKGGGSIEVNDSVIPKERDSRVMGKSFAQQEISIARLKEDARSRFG
jgi:hypothetical protein